MLLEMLKKYLSMFLKGLSFCLSGFLVFLRSYLMIVFIMTFFLSGISALQHQRLPRVKKDNSLDALDAGEHLGQRRSLRAALPIHLQGAPARPQPAGGGAAAH